MANWKHKVRCKDIWEGFEDEKLSVAECAAQFLAQLRKLPKYLTEQDDFEEFETQLEEIAENPDCGKEDFNYVLSEVYDWADRERVWVETF